MPKPASDNQPETQIDPAPNLEKRSRRKFSAAYKLKIITQADACQYGELGLLLRREKLYSAQLKQWRQEYAVGGIDALGKRSPGPVPTVSATDKETMKLRSENTRLRRELEITMSCLDLQKKALAMLDLSNNGSAP
jgi:transposase